AERARLDAEDHLLMHAIVPDPPTLGLRSDAVGRDVLDKQYVRDEVACLLRESGRRVSARFDTAVELVDRLPGSIDAPRSGALTSSVATRLAEGPGLLPDDAAAKVAQRVLPRAGDQTYSAFARAVTRAVHAVDTREIEQRVDAAVARRAVMFTPQHDGTTE